MTAVDRDADVIIVGAGILGALAAERLALKGKSVLMLEAGPRVARGSLLESFRNAPDKNNPNAFYPELPWAPKGSGGQFSDNYIESVGPRRWAPATLRLVGGTTWHWASAFWRFLPNDFKLKTMYGRGRDWPIGYDELEPWYTLAEQITGCSGSNADDQSGLGRSAFPPRSAPYPLPQEKWSTYTTTVAAKLRSVGVQMIDEPHLRATQAYHGRPPCFGNNNCSPLCPIGAMYSGDMTVAAAERAGAKVLPDTVAYRLEKGLGGNLIAVHTKTPDGRSTRRTARYFILAAHGIETPKLMLLSEIGNSSDQVGRNLMSHPGMGWSGLAKDPVWPGRGAIQQGGICTRRDGPHRAQYGSVKYGSNQRSPNLEITERLLKQGVLGRELDERIRHDASRFVNIGGNTEMLPSPTNRITLSDRKDALGLPTPRIYMDIDDYALAAVPVMRKDFALFQKALEIETLLGNSDTFAGLADHIMGSTIMGGDPRDSVVDSDCRSHDHANLFIASTGVFPSGSTVNPTLTGAALSLRIAALIAQEV